MAQALWDRRQTETHIARIGRDLSRSGTPRSDRRRWRAELAGWQPKLAAATRAVAAISAPEIARIDEEDRKLDERLSDLAAQRDSHQRGRASSPRPPTASITSPARSTR